MKNHLFISSFHTFIKTLMAFLTGIFKGKVFLDAILTPLLLVSLGASAAVTMQRVDPVELYRELGYPVASGTRNGGAELPGRIVMVWGAVALTVLSAVYMVCIRKHFRSTASESVNGAAR